MSISNLINPSGETHTSILLRGYIKKRLLKILCTITPSCLSKVLRKQINLVFGIRTSLYAISSYIMKIFQNPELFQILNTSHPKHLGQGASVETPQLYTLPMQTMQTQF